MKADYVGLREQHIEGKLYYKVLAHGRFVRWYPHCPPSFEDSDGRHSFRQLIRTPIRSIGGFPVETARHRPQGGTSLRSGRKVAARVPRPATSRELHRCSASDSNP